MFGFYEFCLLFSFSGPYSLQQAVSAAVSSYRWDQFPLDNRDQPACQATAHLPAPGTARHHLIFSPLSTFSPWQLYVLARLLVSALSGAANCGAATDTKTVGSYSALTSNTFMGQLYNKG